MEKDLKLTARKIAENYLEYLNYEDYLKFKESWIDELENDIENYKNQELQNSGKVIKVNKGNINIY